MAAHLEQHGVPEGIKIVEVFNGGSRDDEDAAAQAMADRFDYMGIGGSDAHIVSHIGRCATEFANPISNEAELVTELKQGAFKAIKPAPSES